MKLPRLWKFETVYGNGRSPYLTRLLIGRLRLHVFHRGDSDPDPHTHPWAFWTFPLTSYVEEVFEPTTGLRRRAVVRAFRLHYRPASHAHRVVARWAGIGRHTRTGAIVTLAWRGRRADTWGFWVRPYGGPSRLVPWREYLRAGDPERPLI